MVEMNSIADLDLALAAQGTPCAGPANVAHNTMQA
jgi:hypothetical protein